MSAGFRTSPQSYAFCVAMRLLPAAICALGAHALLYGSFRPADGVHAYLGWYEPALALAAIAVVVLIRPVSLRSRLPIGETARGLVSRALVIVLVQESLERSLQVGHPAVAAMTPSGWLVLVAGLAATALALALALRAGQAVYSLFDDVRARRLPVLVRKSVGAVTLPAARPHAGNVALRGPPALAG
jgi:hypothetical protein